MTPGKSQNGIPGPPTYHTNSPPPYILNICLETRAEAIRQAAYCALEDNVKKPILFRPLIDAIFYRFNHHIQNFAFPGLNRIRHLIIDHSMPGNDIARFSRLVHLTIIPHQFAAWFPCRTTPLANGKPEPRAEFFRPRYHEAHSWTAFYSQLGAMENHKRLYHPLWKLPKLNILRSMMGGKICCVPQNHATRSD